MPTLDSCLIWGHVNREDMGIDGNGMDARDDGDGTGHQLIGAGRPITMAEREDVRRLLMPVIMLAGWLETDLPHNCKNVCAFKQADITGIGSINALSYACAVSRRSFWVLCRFELSTGGDKLWVGRVQRFLKVEQPAATGGAHLRIAVCDLWLPLQPRPDGVIVINKERINHESYPVDLQSIEALLVSAEPSKPMRVPGRPEPRYYHSEDVGKVFLVRYGNVSRMA